MLQYWAPSIAFILQHHTAFKKSFQSMSPAHPSGIVPTTIPSNRSGFSYWQGHVQKHRRFAWRTAYLILTFQFPIVACWWNQSNDIHSIHSSRYAISTVQVQLCTEVSCRQFLYEWPGPTKAWHDIWSLFQWNTARDADRCYSVAPRMFQCETSVPSHWFRSTSDQEFAATSSNRNSFLQQPCKIILPPKSFFLFKPFSAGSL